MIYTLHMREAARPLPGDDVGETRFDGLMAVPDTVAIWALIFAPFWLWFHRLWWVLGIYLLLIILTFGLLATPFAPASILLSGLPGLYLFLEGNQLRRDKLERHGFETVGVVDAPNERTAIERYLANWQAPVDGPRTNPAPETPHINSEPKPTFGMFPQGEN